MEKIDPSIFTISVKLNTTIPALDENLERSGYLWQKRDHDAEEDGVDVGSLLEGIGQRVLVVDLVGEFGNGRHFRAGTKNKDMLNAVVSDLERGHGFDSWRKQLF